MVKLYAADIDTLPDPREAEVLMKLLCAQRREKVLRYLQADDRKRSLGAWLLLRKVLSCHGVRPDDIQIAEGGKPFAEGISFNLSHSGRMVVCAVGEKNVGCDVEKIAEAPEQVAERFFHPKELEYLKSCEDEDKNECFFRLWTMKESYMKMTGEGMRLPFNRFEIVPEEGSFGVRRDGHLLACSLMEYRISGYRAAVCAEEPISPAIIYKKL